MTIIFPHNPTLVPRAQYIYLLKCNYLVDAKAIPACMLSFCAVCTQSFCLDCPFLPLSAKS